MTAGSPYREFDTSRWQLSKQDTSKEQARRCDINNKRSYATKGDRMSESVSKYLLREHKLRRAYNFISGDMRGSLKGLAADSGEHRQAAGAIALAELIAARLRNFTQWSITRANFAAVEGL